MSLFLYLTSFPNERVESSYLELNRRTIGREFRSQYLQNLGQSDLRAAVALRLFYQTLHPDCVDLFLDRNELRNHKMDKSLRKLEEFAVVKRVGLQVLRQDLSGKKLQDFVQPLFNNLFNEHLDVRAIRAKLGTKIETNQGLRMSIRDAVAKEFLEERAEAQKFLCESCLQKFGDGSSSALALASTSGTTSTTEQKNAKARSHSEVGDPDDSADLAPPEKRRKPSDN